MTFEVARRRVAELQADGVLLVEDGNHGENRPRREEFDARGTAFIRAADIRDGRADFAGAERINDIALARIRKGRGAPGDLLLTHKGTVGRVARIPADAPSFVCSPQTTLWRVIDRDRLDPDFLYGYLRCPAFERQLYERMHDTDMAPYVSLTAQRGLEVPLPPISEQRRIGGMLRTLDDKIDSNRRLTALLEEILEAAFRARFVDFVGVDAFEDSEIGRIPRGWLVAPIGRILRVVGGSTPSTKVPAYWQDGSFFWVTPKDLAGHTSAVLLGSRRVITHAGLKRISSGLLPPETVLLSSRAPIGYTVLSKVPVAVNQGFIAIPPSDRVPSEYVLLWLRENMDAIRSNAGGTTFAEISKRDFRPIPMLIPPPAELEEFGAMARAVTALIASLDRERFVVADVRDALLPKLVSGAIRSDPNGPGEPVPCALADLATAS